MAPLGQEYALKVTSFKLSPEHLRFLNEEAVRGRHIARGRLSRSAALRAVIEKWVDSGSPKPELDTERPAELVTKSFSLEQTAHEAIEDATVLWSTADTLVDKSQVVRALLDSAAQTTSAHSSDESKS